MEIFFLHEHSRASFSPMLPNVIKISTLELLESGLFLLKCHLPEMKYQHRMQKFMSSQFHPEALTKISVLFLCVYVALILSPLEKLLLATSVMRLHRKIFHDTKTLLSKTFFSISTQLFHSTSSPNSSSFLVLNTKDCPRVRKTFSQT